MAILHRCCQEAECLQRCLQGPRQGHLLSFTGCETIMHTIIKRQHEEQQHNESALHAVVLSLHRKITPP